MNGGWIDLSVDVHPGMPVWEGSATPVLTPVCEIGPDSSCRVTRVELDAHLGTHLDAPGHFLPGGAMVESLSLEDLIGPCTVRDSADAALVTDAVLESLDIPEACVRLLLRTRNTRRGLMFRPDFVRDYVGLDLSGARWLVRRGVRLVGLDYLSVQAFDASDDVHRELLGVSMVLVEGLDLREADPGEYDLVCLPPRWRGADGAPARVVARRV